ncbi:Predicted phosphohydrolase or phosphomutase, AlkP superfamily [Natronoarchaeum philippinense]|uniref:Predicted phosphohydrolase or phosphomutase, AlkP superfamily n=1 Tax=Natronoarchaeum philippinense TaxID=558529 RepID=A0A285P0Y2_NATPI|nr:alkaline phosphatase family protein [Natronoarchaeum philippinense]SNZ15385.1 Predicted phosphohydrolase or phosphomutase, AlkP superfamily [Natronoarchaeum philippinense]
MTTVVVGLDGASFELIDRWIDEGELPAIEQLVEDGVSSDLQSCVPPVTCPNWQAYATGTNPGKLGVFWWEYIDREEHDIYSTSSAENFNGTHYWNYLDGRSAVVNLPTSYPPSDIDGIHIAGGPGAEQSGYTSPAELETELQEEYDYKVHPEKLGELSVDSPDSDCIDEIYELIDNRFDIVEDLLTDGEYELIHVTVFYLNVLHHFFWDDEIVKAAWTKIDQRLERLLETDEMDRLFVMSDHGSNEIQVSFRINAWLEEQGYLETTGGIADLLYRFGLTRERVRPILANAGIEWFMRTLLPSRIQNALPDESGAVTQGAKASVIDWDASKAVASGQGPVYVLSEDETEREKITDELISKLDGLEHEGTEIVSAVPSSEVYDGPARADGPDILLRQAPGVHIEGKIGDVAPFGTPDRWRGENKETGLFIASGPDIKAGEQLGSMDITEIAPTLLHLHGQSIPQNLDDDPRVDIFQEGTAPAETDVTTARAGKIDSDQGATAHEESEVSDRLADLGYLE